jgi:hypothetical protein
MTAPVMEWKKPGVHCILMRVVCTLTQADIDKMDESQRQYYTPNSKRMKILILYHANPDSLNSYYWDEYHHSDNPVFLNGQFTIRDTGKFIGNETRYKSFVELRQILRGGSGIDTNGLTWKLASINPLKTVFTGTKYIVSALPAYDPATTGVEATIDSLFAPVMMGKFADNECIFMKLECDGSQAAVAFVHERENRYNLLFVGKKGDSSPCFTAGSYSVECKVIRQLLQGESVEDINKKVWKLSA